MELDSTAHSITRLAVRKNDVNSCQINDVKRATDSKCLKKNNKKSSVKNSKQSGGNKATRVSPRLAQKQYDEALSPTNPNANSDVKPSETRKKRRQRRHTVPKLKKNLEVTESSASQNSFGENISTSSPKYTQNTSQPVVKPKKTCNKKQQRRHTVSVFKKNKISACRNITVTKYSKNVALQFQKTSLRSNEETNHQEADECFHHLNDIPVDDLAVALFSTPNTSNNMSQRKSNAASTPCLNRKSAAHQLKTKRSEEILPDGVISPKKHFPSKGTLKRKRQFINSLKERNQGYEDDLFESNQFNDFRDALQMEDDSDTSLMSIATPKCAFLVTPKLSAKTPRYKDCYSPVELLNARKVAEEYIHRRNKNKLKTSTTSEVVSPEEDHQNEDSKMDSGIEVLGSPPEKKKLEFTSRVKNLSAKNNKLETENDSEEGIDVYFSDASP